jgi:hypothetical protein
MQDRTNTRPSDIAKVEAFRTVRGLLNDAVRDTQSLEKPLGQLRIGYTTHPQGIEEQRYIVSAAARHSGRTPEQIQAIVERTHSVSLETLGPTSQIETIKAKLGFEEYARKREELYEAMGEAQDEIGRATLRANLDKIDNTLTLLKELRALLELKERGATHDAKRLRGLSRMCSMNTLDEVRETIPALEALRKRNAEGEFNETMRRETHRIEDLQLALRELDHDMESKWCAQYDEITFMQQRLAELEGKMLEYSQLHGDALPKELGNLVPLEKQVDLKVDLAKFKLKHSHLTVYTLSDLEGGLTAQVLDTGREFDVQRDVRYVSVAIDDPSTILALKPTEGGVRVEAHDKRTFQKQILDVEASARSEIANSFSPTLCGAGSVGDVILKGETIFFSFWTNPGCGIDIRELVQSVTRELTLRGSGRVYVGEVSPQSPLVKVKIEETLKGQAPLVIVVPTGLSVGDIKLSYSSGTDFSLSIGNATFEQLGFRSDGRGHDVDVEVKTPRGVQRIAIVRDGRSVLPGTP